MHVYAYIAITAVVLLFVYMLRKVLHTKRPRRTVKSGTVILHQFGPSYSAHIVESSPPCLKLQTFLRMAKIPHECDYGMMMSKKGKVPWIEFNGEEVADSNFCIQFLSKKFEVDIDSHLTAEQRAIGHCVRTMLEENTYWGLVYYRFLTDYAFEMRDRFFGDLWFPLKHLVFYKVKRKLAGDLWSHGIGRHSEKELFGIMEKDLVAISEILGNKKFLFGDKPCLADLALFAFVATTSWDCPNSPFADLTKSKVQNLETHAQTVKELFYPDWNEIINYSKK